MERLTVETEGHSFWLANRHDALYNAGGGVSIPAVAGGAASADVGTHYDLGLQVGHLFPGAFAGAGRTF